MGSLMTNGQCPLKRLKVSFNSRMCLVRNINDNIRTLRANFTFALILLQFFDLSSVTASPVVVRLDYLQGPVSLARNIRHLPCISKSTGQEGRCMFAIDCNKVNGTHLGTCIDGFYFGSCCQIIDKTTLPEIASNYIEDNSIEGAFVNPLTNEKVQSTIIIQLPNNDKNKKKKPTTLLPHTDKPQVEDKTVPDKVEIKPDKDVTTVTETEIKSSASTGAASNKDKASTESIEHFKPVVETTSATTTQVFISTDESTTTTTKTTTTNLPTTAEQVTETTENLVTETSVSSVPTEAISTITTVGLLDTVTTEIAQEIEPFTEKNTSLDESTMKKTLRPVTEEEVTTQLTTSVEYLPLVTWSDTIYSSTKPSETTTSAESETGLPITPSSVSPIQETTTPQTTLTTMPTVTTITMESPTTIVKSSIEITTKSSTSTETLTSLSPSTLVSTTELLTTPTFSLISNSSTIVSQTDTTTSGFTEEEVSTTNDVTTEPTTTVETITEYNMSDYKDVCGRRMLPEARIVGGTNSTFGQWPWQISLLQYVKSSYQHKCGAALLNENWAITAAHCIGEIPPSDLLLRIGEYDFANDDEPYSFVERRVQIVASHPHFDKNTYEYDLALLRFHEPVSFQPNIVPVCLPEDDDDYVGRTAYITGWGQLYYKGPLPSVLQVVQVPVINNTACESMFRAAGYNEHIPHIFICAGWKRGGLDSCEGDSGGPMVIPNKEDGRFVLSGVISWGIDCAQPNQPGVYTRISEYRHWINQILQF